MRAARDLLLVGLVTLVPWFGRGPPVVAIGAPVRAEACERFVEGEDGVRCLPEGQTPERHPRSTMAPARLAALGVPVDLNRATVEELASLDGVGRKLAERIIAGRPFRVVDDVLRVRGIGRKRMERLRAR